MCGKKSRRFLVSLALLLLVSLPSYSEGVAAGQVTDDQLLTECVTRLETTTNELENALNLIARYRTQSASQIALIGRLYGTISERDERLIAIGISLSEHEKESAAYQRTTRRLSIRNVAIGFSVGAGIGVVTGLVFGGM